MWLKCCARRWLHGQRVWDVAQQVLARQGALYIQRHCLQVQGTSCVCSAEFIVLRFFDNAEDVLPHIVIVGSQEAFKLLRVRHAREVVDGGAKSMEIGLPSECVKLDAGTTSAEAAVFAVSAS